MSALLHMPCALCIGKIDLADLTDDFAALILDQLFAVTDAQERAETAAGVMLPAGGHHDALDEYIGIVASYCTSNRCGQCRVCEAVQALERCKPKASERAWPMLRSEILEGFIGSLCIDHRSFADRVRNAATRHPSLSAPGGLS